MDLPFDRHTFDQELWDSADDGEVATAFDARGRGEADGAPHPLAVERHGTSATPDTVGSAPRANALVALFDRGVRCVYVGNVPYVVLDFALALAVQALRGKPMKRAALVAHARALQVRCFRLYGHLLNDGDAVRLCEPLQPPPHADPPFDRPARASSSWHLPIAYSASGLRWLMVCAGGRKSLDDSLNMLARSGALDRLCARLDAETRSARTALSSVTLSVCDGRTAPMTALRHSAHSDVWTVTGSDASDRSVDADTRVARALVAATAARARRDGAIVSLFVDGVPVVLPLAGTIAFEHALSGAFGVPRYGTPSVAAVPLDL